MKSNKTYKAKQLNTRKWGVLIESDPKNDVLSGLFKTKKSAQKSAKKMKDARVIKVMILEVT